MTPILILEAFGHLPSTDLIESERERERRERMDPPKGAVKVGILHHAFESRTELMGWSATSPRTPLPPPLWNMFEAGLTDNTEDASLIGWVYVGLANPIDLSKALPGLVQSGTTGAGWAAVRMPPGYADSTVALPVAIVPLVQCLDDALRRIGATEVYGFQVTCYGANLRTGGRYRGHLVSGASWFDVLSPEEAANALISFDKGFLGDSPVNELMRGLSHRSGFPFGFHLAPDAPEQLKVRKPGSTPSPDVPFEPSSVGVSVKMPEWTASAAGWALAAVTDAAHAIAPDVEDFAVRITRVG